MIPKPSQRLNVHGMTARDVAVLLEQQTKANLDFLAKGFGK